jgi:2-oxoglutarate dehydrogenase E2 component (dihydrolipoamide succinyltransferase)
MLTEIRALQIGKTEMRPSIGRWFKRVGDPVTAGDPLVETDTRDGTIEVQSPSTGILSEVCLRDGQYLQAGALLGMITEYDQP